MTKRRLTKAQAGERLNRILAVVALIVAILGLCIAFAVVTRNLTINGIAKIQGPEWNIHFTTQSSSASGGAQINSTKVDDRTISYHVVFTAPNQTADINFQMTNSSVVNAEIAAITTTGQNDYSAKHIGYNLQYTNGTNISVGDLLSAGASRDAKIHLAYNATQAEFIADAGSQVGMTVTIQYAQAP
ncbi:MAG: hypothetical protein LBK50_03195 [Candidatus Nomurabacteria bacterium]|jgi:hypothetical protein|nr:hypothetical protein [Candidatus Nomurabacteria bacterium]